MNASPPALSHLATACSSTLLVSSAPSVRHQRRGRHQVVEHAGQLAEGLGAVHGVGPLVVLLAVEPPLGVGLGEGAEHDVAVGVGGPHRRELRRPRVVGELAPQLGSGHVVIVRRVPSWTQRRCRPTAWACPEPGPTARGSHEHTGDQGRAGGAGQDLRVPRRRRRGRQERSQPRGGRRVAAAVPGRCHGDGVHRPVRLERPDLRRRHPRRGPARRRRRVLPAGRRGTAQEAAARRAGTGPRVCWPAARR